MGQPAGRLSMAEELGIRVEGLQARTMPENKPAEINTVMQERFNKGEQARSFGVQRAELDAIHIVRPFRPLCTLRVCNLFIALAVRRRQQEPQ